jgi:hypothetical protein
LWHIEDGSGVGDNPSSLGVVKQRHPEISREGASVLWETVVREHSTE